MAEFASKGVAGTALGTGIAGLSLGVLNSLGGLGGMLLGNRAIPFAAGMAAEAGCSENHTVNRYELSMVQENAKLRSDIALRDANTYQDQKMLEMYKYIDGKLGEVQGALASQAINNQATKDSFQLLQERMDCCKNELCGSGTSGSALTTPLSPTPTPPFIPKWSRTSPPAPAPRPSPPITPSPSPTAAAAAKRRRGKKRGA